MGTVGHPGPRSVLPEFSCLLENHILSERNGRVKAEVGVRLVGTN